MGKLGVGIVGCGHNGGNHAQVWSRIDEAAIVGVYDMNEAARPSAPPSSASGRSRASRRWSPSPPSRRWTW